MGTTAVFANFIPYTGYAQSSGTVNVTITPAGTTPTPTFAPPAGNYTSTQQVILNDTNTSGNIYYYYTTNGSILVVGSSNILVTGEPLPVGASETIQAIAVAPGYSASSVASATYTITLPPPSFTLTGTSVSVFPGATSGNTSIISVTPTGGFTGSVVLTASVTSSPTGAQYPPTLSFGSTSPVTLTGSGVQTATLTVSTTAANSAAVVPPKNPGILWNTAAGTVLACTLLLGVPAQRRRWSRLLGMLLLAIPLAGGMLACGGSSGSGGGLSSGSPGTTAGTYIVTISAVSSAITQTGTLTVTVQ